MADTCILASLYSDVLQSNWLYLIKYETTNKEFASGSCVTVVLGTFLSLWWPISGRHITEPRQHRCQRNGMYQVLALMETHKKLCRVMEELCGGKGALERDEHSLLWYIAITYLHVCGLQRKLCTQRKGTQVQRHTTTTTTTKLHTAADTDEPSTASLCPPPRWTFIIKGHIGHILLTTRANDALTLPSCYTV